MFLLAIGCATLAHARGVCDGAAFCGGIANKACKSGYTCLDDPDDTCDPSNGGRDCSGCCVRLVIPETSSSAAASVDTCAMCGGVANIQCSAGFTCMDDTRDNCDPNNGGRDCSGCCVRLVIPERSSSAAASLDTCTMCGGIANIQCAAGFTCKDDTRDNCDPNNGGRDCSGCCVRLVIPETSSSAAASVDTCTMCGGIANIQCDAGFACMDDTRDNCDPNNGGSDCSGCCVRLVIPENRKPAPVDTCTMCGGIANIQCDAGFTCMDDTRDNCDRNNGGRDCSGCCVRLVIPENRKPAPVDTCTMCGGIANIQCDAGFNCMDDTRDNCDPNNGGLDCSGCCVRLVVPESRKPAPVDDSCTMCGGIANIQCDAGFTCMDDTRDNCDRNNGGSDCSGCCVRLVIPENRKPAPVDTCTMCGGIANIQCDAGFTCMDDTRDNCDPNNGGLDCSGCCVRLVVPESRRPAPVDDSCTMCGGIANIQCDAGFTCMDDTRDNCDPNNGGRDCSGCCVSPVGLQN